MCGLDTDEAGRRIDCEDQRQQQQRTAKRTDSGFGVAITDIVNHTGAPAS
jgi:hypothetical protein